MKSSAQATVLATFRRSTETFLTRSEIARRAGIDLPETEVVIAALLERRLLVATKGGRFVTLSGFA